MATVIIVAGVAYGALAGAEGGSVSAGDGAPPHALEGSPLQGAPWLSQPGGSPSIDEVEPRASIRLPVDVDYADALRQLYVSALERGELPAGAVIVDPLPAEVVLVEPEDASEGIRLSLTAPWGWDLETRTIRPPSLRLPGRLAPEEVSRRIEAARAEGAALPEGAAVDVPTLGSCQAARGHPANRPACPSATPEEPHG